MPACCQAFTLQPYDHLIGCTASAFETYICKTVQEILIHSSRTSDSRLIAALGLRGADPRGGWLRRRLISGYGWTWGGTYQDWSSEEKLRNSVR